MNITKNIKSIFSKGSDFALDKLFLIGSTLAATKVVFIVIPYFFNSAQYNEFNKIYYTASLLILFGSIGFNISVSRMSFKTYKVFSAVLFNIIVTFVLLKIIAGVAVDLPAALSILVYVAFGCIGGIYSFKLLFEGNYKAYSIAMFLYALFHLLVIPVVLISKANLTTIFPFITLLWFLSCYKLFFNGKLKVRGCHAELDSASKNYSKMQIPNQVRNDKDHDILISRSFSEKDKVKDNGVKALYSTGLSAFIINNMVPLALVLDKYYVNHFFGTTVANAYTFAWGLTAPLFYIGVLIEKMIYSSKGANPFAVIKKSFLLLLSLVIAYCLLFTAGLRYFPFLIPHSVDASLLVNIFTLMIAGYSLYVLFHFPVNGYLFKFSSIVNQNKVASAFLVFAVVFGTAVYLLFSFVITVNYLTLLLTIWLFIFCLLFIKIKVISGNLNFGKLAAVIE